MRCLNNGILHVETSETGARVTTARKGEKHYLYPQQIVNIKGKDTMRGGMHPCSPIFGKKEKGRFAGIPQHGGLRDVIWENKWFHSSAGTDYFCRFEKFGYRVDYEVNYQIELNRFKVRTRVENLLSDSISFEFGWHPYLYAPNGAKVNIVGVTKKPLDINGAYGWEIFNSREEIEIVLNGIGVVRMYLLQGFSNVCVWTDWQRNYVCVEPLISHPDDFNSSRGFTLVHDNPVTTRLEMGFEG